MQTRLAFVAVVLAAQVIPAKAQPVMADDRRGIDTARSGGGNGTRIPVEMPTDTEVLGAEAVGSSAPAASVSLEQPIDPDAYICGPGDVFELNFWGQQNFRLRVAADLEGRAFISKVGFVSVTGKTLTTVRGEVQKKVRGTYPGLKFEVTLIDPRSFLVHVVDYVKQPGSYTAHPFDRVSAILTRAGGSTGSRRRITIRRSGTELTADLVMYELTGDTSFNPFVLDGDIINVPFAEVSASIDGAVRRPGKYELVKTKDLAELVALAGGLTSSVARSQPIIVVRHEAHERATSLELPFSGTATPNTSLKDSDAVTVRDARQLQRSILVIGAVSGATAVDAATTSIRLAFVDGDTVFSLVDRAGGIKASGDLSHAYISRARAGKDPELIPVDLEALLVRREFSADKKLTMNDTLVIPPMQYSVLVEGAVTRGGMYPFNPQFGIAEYIAHAGGRTRSARDLDEVTLIDWAGRTHAYKPGMKPSPGDSILVPERNFTRAEVVQIALAAAGLIVSGVAITLAATR
jgi:polysaccharide biosynthesis/export protein